MQQQDHFPTIPGLTGRFFSPSLPDSTTRHHQQPHPQPVKCPRCDSPNTKFCYFNNYNLSQPRHFCKACRRYWTKGGVLRNVPVGGATRKNPSKSKPAKPKPANKPPKPKPAARSSSESSSITAATSADPDPIPAELGTDPVFPDPGLVNGFRVPDPGVGGLDWGVSMFDMTSSVDPAVYWNQTAQWGDTDPSLYLP